MTLFTKIIMVVVVMAAICFTLFQYCKLAWRLNIPVKLYICLQGFFITLSLISAFDATRISNDILRSFIMRLSGVYCTMLFYSAILMIIRHIICAVIKAAESENKVCKFICNTKKGMGTIFIVTLGVGLFSLFQIKNYQVTNYSVANVMDKDMKVLAISDLHVGTGVLKSNIDDLIEKIDSEKPDLILIVGDVFDHNTTEPQKQAMVGGLARLNCKYGKYFVEGESDVRVGDMDKYMAAAGVKPLYDRVVKLPTGLQIVGARDTSDKEKKPVETTFTGVDPGKPIMYVSHRPKFLDKVSEEGADLAICGHTHGGQLFPNPAMAIFNDMNYGMAKFGDMTAITTCGVGGSFIPVKCGVKAEIVTITG